MGSRSSSDAEARSAPRGKERCDFEREQGSGSTYADTLGASSSITLAKELAGPGSPFHVTIEKAAGSELGLHLAVGLLDSIMPGVVFVVGVDADGALARHNKVNWDNPDKRIKPGCIIYAIAGQVRHPLPVHALKTQETVQLSCVNWTRHVVVTKGATGLGLQLLRNGAVAEVCGILEGGSISRYNKDNPLSPLNIGDCIVEVNGENVFEPLLRELERSLTVNMTILRIQDSTLVAPLTWV